MRLFIPIVAALLISMAVTAKASDSYDRFTLEFEADRTPPMMMAAAAQAEEEFKDEFAVETAPIADPLEGFNRAMYRFNDWLYHAAVKPLAKGYGSVVPEAGRRSVDRFFRNATTPVRLVNSLLQFKFKRAATEYWRFACNTTLGVGGLWDPAFTRFGLTMKDEDTGQTLGHWGFGPGFYIHWPILGPSSLRDSVGLVGDTFLDPRSYLFPHAEGASTGIKAYDKVNELSLDIEFLDDMLKDAVDPYQQLRDFWHQYRENRVKD